jgi:hypothetical protein
VDVAPSDTSAEAVRVQVARAKLERGEELEPPRLLSSPQPPPRPKAPPPPPKGSGEQLAQRIAEMETDVFAYDELRRGLEIDYEELIVLLFALLEDPDSGLAQVFDPAAAAMRLSRASR